MFFRPNPASGVPVYIQLMEQVKHFIETGALRPGDQLPAIRKVAEDLVVNPNTVATSSCATARARSARSAPGWRWRSACARRGPSRAGPS